jgi:hypothetical protein
VPASSSPVQPSHGELALLLHGSPISPLGSLQLKPASGEPMTFGVHVVPM